MFVFTHLFFAPLFDVPHSSTSLFQLKVKSYKLKVNE
jgi:hypothetical protein